MILVGHALVGAALAAPTHNPFLAFFVALMSHYVVDAIPHYEYGFDYLLREKGKKRLWLDLTKIGIDGALGVASALLIFQPTNSASFWVLSAAIVGAMLPDFLQGVYLVWPTKLITALYKFHLAIHSTYGFEDRPLLGIASQLLIVGLFLWYGLSFL